MKKQEKDRVQKYLKTWGISMRKFVNVVEKIEKHLWLNENEKGKICLEWSGHCLCGLVEYKNFCSPTWVFVSNIFHRQAEKKCPGENNQHEVAIYCSKRIFEKREFLGTISGYNFKPYKPTGKWN